jgi:hypothetical protein
MITEDFQQSSVIMECRAPTLVVVQNLLWPAGLARDAARILGRLHGHGLQILGAEEPDQDAAVAVITSNPRDDDDLGARIPPSPPTARPRPWFSLRFRGRLCRGAAGNGGR